MKASRIFLVLMVLGTVAFAAGDQPRMQAALVDLRTAKRELQIAMPDKGGHRVNAIALVNRAIGEVNAGIAYDRRHNHANSVTLDSLFVASPDQPHMENAKSALENAKDNLEHATTDKGGHRARALDLVKDAISEVKKGIEAGR
jgi:hypothetical protein